MSASETIQRQTKRTTVHWYILGAGAIGCLWAASFRRAGFPVTLITRDRRDSHRISLVTGDETIECDLKTETVAEFLASEQVPSRLLVTTKAHHTDTALEAIRSRISNDTLLLILQNGLAARQVAEEFPNSPLLAAITSDGAYRSDGMTVVFSGTGKTFIGSYDGTDHSGILDELPTAFLDIEYCDDIEIRQWQKLAVNCAINGLTAIYHCRNGELLDKPQALASMERICNEVMAVTGALGFPPDRFAGCYEAARATARSTAANYSSMYKDIEQGRRTEIDFINGYLCREANRLQISCPENRAIVNAIKQLEQSHQ